MVFEVLYLINFPYADRDKDRYTRTGTEMERKGEGLKDRERDRIVSFPNPQQDT